MKLITFDDWQVGHVIEDTVIELDCASMRAYFERGGDVEPTGREFALGEVRLRTPLNAKKVFHTAGHYNEHREEMKSADWPHEVSWVCTFVNVDSIIGPDEPIVYPEGITKQLDYEIELSVVIKKSGKFLTPEESADYIGGYTIYNDISARDIQWEEAKSGVLCMCKAIDTFSPIGPWIVTPDEIDDPRNLKLELRVNGEVRQSSNTSHMSVTIPEIISHFSPMGYSAGDILSTGTVAGVAAFSADPEAWYLKPGDVVEAEIEKIGILRNPVVPWSHAHDRPWSF